MQTVYLFLCSSFCYTRIMQDILSLKGDETMCAIALVIKDGNVLQGYRHYTPDTWKTISVWTCPGGRCDEGETLEEVLRREIEEETGITNVTIVNYVGETLGAKENDYLYIFHAATQEEPTLMEPEKFSEWRWVSISEYIKNEPEVNFNPAARELMISYLKNL